jgi:hypothetical protein
MLQAWAPAATFFMDCSYGMALELIDKIVFSACQLLCKQPMTIQFPESRWQRALPAY